MSERVARTYEHSTVELSYGKGAGSGLFSTVMALALFKRLKRISSTRPTFIVLHCAFFPLILHE